MVQDRNDMPLTWKARQGRVATPPFPSGDRCLEEVCDIAAIICRADGAFMVQSTSDGLQVFARSAGLRMALPDILPAEILGGDPAPAETTPCRFGGDEPGRAMPKARAAASRQIPVWLRKKRFHSVRFALPQGGADAHLLVGADDMPRILTSVQAIALTKLARTTARLVDLEQGAKAAVRKLFETIEATKE